MELSPGHHGWDYLRSIMEKQYGAEMEALGARMPEDHRYIKVPDGWYGLVHLLFQELDAEVPGVQPQEVAQRFGSLSITLALPEETPTALRKRAHELVFLAAQAAEHTCELCGGVGVRSVANGWQGGVRISCEPCNWRTGWHPVKP